MKTSRRRLFYWRRWRSLDVGCVECLVRLARKYDVDPYKLLSSIIEAEKEKTVVCGTLRIMLREKAQDYAIFLLTCGSEIAAQIRVESQAWKDPIQIMKLCALLMDDIRPRMEKPPASIKELRKGMKNVNLKVVVTKKSEVLTRYSRYDGSSFHLCIAMVTDPSGSIKMPLYNNQIGQISVGDQIEIRKASVREFQGSLQIVPNRRNGELVTVSTCSSH